MSCSLNSLKGAIDGIIYGRIIGLIRGILVFWTLAHMISIGFFEVGVTKLPLLIGPGHV